MTQIHNRGIDFLQEAAKCFGTVRQNLIEGAALLHKIFTEKLYEAKYDSFEEYIEEECQIKPSFASKLIAVHGYWVVESKLSQRKLIGTDIEKLYLARKLEGDPEYNLVKAQTLSRDDLKAELREEVVPCQAHTPVTFCSTCRIRL